MEIETVLMTRPIYYFFQQSPVEIDSILVTQGSINHTWIF